MKSVAKNNADGSESIGGGGQMIKGWTTICQAKAGGGQMIEGWTTICQAKSPKCKSEFNVWRQSLQALTYVLYAILR